MANLLEETKEAIKGSGHKVKDILFIGSEETGHNCTWKEFKELANVEYDSGFGAVKVAQDLIIVFNDGAKIWRGGHDGSEWWDFSTPFKMPKELKPIKRITVDGTDKVVWCDLEELNEE